MLLYIVKSVWIKSQVLPLEGTCSWGKDFYSILFHRKLCSFASVLTNPLLTQYKQQPGQCGKLMNRVGGLLRVSEAAKDHERFMEGICFLAQGRGDFTLVFSSSSAATVFANIGPNSGTRLSVCLNPPVANNLNLFSLRSIRLEDVVKIKHSLKWFAKISLYSSLGYKQNQTNQAFVHSSREKRVAGWYPASSGISRTWQKS